MLILGLQEDQAIVLTERGSGKEIARLILCERKRSYNNDRIGIVANRDTIAVHRESKRLETAGAAM